MLDFVSIWKIISTLLTGFFGILGLLKEFKDKSTGKITTYGKISLVGIIFSAGFGVLAQIKEQSDQEAAKDKTINQTLEIAKSTQQSVREVKRLIYAIGKPRIDIDFDYICDVTTKQFCDKVRQISSKSEVDLKKIASQDNPAKDFSIRLDIFRNKKEFIDVLEHDGFSPDLTYTIDNLDANKSDRNGIVISSLSIFPKDSGDDLNFSMLATEVNIRESNGAIVGMEDLSGSYFIIFGLHEKLQVTGIEITTSNNIRTKLLIESCQFSKHSALKPDNTVTIFSHLGEYINACRFSEKQSVGSFSK